ncbi:MAG: flagellar motor protein MotB [Pseudomonadota bacterium]
MAQQGAPIVIKKKHGGHDHGHHGGAWKVAYADFVTAMMAFFLLLWLLNATSEEQRAGLANYFDPTFPISMNSGGGAGIMGGPDVFSPANRAGQSDTGVPPRNDIPVSASGAAEAPENAIRFDGDAPEGAVEPAGTGAEADGAAGEDGAGTGGAGPAETPLDVGALAEDGHVMVSTLPDGLLIELIDLVDEPLFESAGAQPTPILRNLATAVATSIADLPNSLQVIGHTDGVPFAPGSSYGNWELSADRANAARRLIIAAGVDPARITAVIGRGATDLAVPDPADPRNRRIAIKLLTAAESGR